MTHTPTAPAPYVLSAPADGLLVAERGREVVIHVADAETSAVRRAALDLATDLARVTGALPVLSPQPAAARIVVGTLGVSPAVDDAVAAGILDIDALRDDAGALHWEGFLVAAVGDVLYLVGADRRGTVYAVYDLTRAIGVSPWHWWGDVPVRTRDAVVIATGTHHADRPSVRYRGIFINDEEELYHWAKAHTADGTIGPETYERIYELILRLKGNYLWPAMHVGAFNHDPENGRLAHEMGVVIGTSHCDMLLRSNEHEFRPWVEGRGQDVRYDYSIEGRNRDMLKEYWRGSVAQNGDYEVTWTVGIRGVHDSGFETEAIDGDDTLSDEQKLRARVDLLEQAITDQRALLSEGLGVEASEAPQLFVPYKEVLPLYDAGLQVPEDVTLVWANDNFGHIRRFPTDAEQARPGGNGLYYHSSYWSNYTTSYLATSSTPLALMKAELRRAWDNGIRRLWVDNIGGLKPLEIEMEFFIRSGWEAGRETTTADVPAFVAQWVDEAFSGGHGRRAGAIYAEYYQLNNQRKYEHLTAGVFPQTGFGDEAGRRLAALRRLYDETNDILRRLPEDERDAFFQLFAVKIHMSYLTNAEFYHADRSTLAMTQGRPAAADRHVALARALDEHKRALIRSYNTVMSGGRWNGIFTPEEFPPPVMPLHPAATPALRIDPDEHAITVTAWGDAGPAARPTLTFWPHGVASKWIELAAAGAPEFSYELECDPWIELGSAAGTADAEARIAVRVPDAAAAAGRTGAIRVRSGAQTIEVAVHVAPLPDLAEGFSGSVESDGTVSLDPSRPDATLDQADARWVRAALLGRDGSDAMRAAVSRTGSTEHAVAEFHLHLETPGAHVLEVHRVPTLDSTGRIRLGVSVDDHAMSVVESPTTDEHRGTWSAAIQDNVEKLALMLPALAAGPHTIRLHTIDPDVTVSKLVLRTETARPANLGPVFSVHTARPAEQVADPDPLDAGLDELDRVARELYRVVPASVPLPRQLYADRTFWEGATTFRPARAVDQVARGSALAAATAAGGIDRVAALGAGAHVESAGVIAIEAESVLAEDADAWTTPAADPGLPGWTHTASDTDGGTGLAMHVSPRALVWDDPAAAPGLHFAIDVTAPGEYRVWLRVKFDDDRDDSCVIALDGVPQSLDEQFSRGALCTYGARQVWLWAHVSDLAISAGRHTLSVLAREAGLRVDRLYLTLGDELPPVDAAWAPAARHPSPRPATAVPVLERS